MIIRAFQNCLHTQFASLTISTITSCDGFESERRITLSRNDLITRCALWVLSVADEKPASDDRNWITCPNALTFLGRRQDPFVCG